MSSNSFRAALEADEESKNLTVMAIISKLYEKHEITPTVRSMRPSLSQHSSQMADVAQANFQFALNRINDNGVMSVKPNPVGRGMGLVPATERSAVVILGEVDARNPSPFGSAAAGDTF
jgi:hypothetical protein